MYGNVLRMGVEMRDAGRRGKRKGRQGQCSQRFDRSDYLGTSQVHEMWLVVAQSWLTHQPGL